MHILYGHSLTYRLSLRVEGNYGRESSANQAKHQGIPNRQTHLPSSSTSGSTTALTHIVLPLSNSRSYRRWRRRTRLDVVQSKGLPWSPSALPASHMSESRVFFGRRGWRTLISCYPWRMRSQGGEWVIMMKFGAAQSVQHHRENSLSIG
jgi:hypothetical protein